MILSFALEKACYEYMRYMNDNGKIAFPHDNWVAGFEFLSRI